MSRQIKLIVLTALLIVIINILTTNCNTPVDSNDGNEELDVNSINSTNITTAIAQPKEIARTTTYVPWHLRPITCDNETEVLHNCSNSCHATCEEPSKEPCRYKHCWKGCECKPGYVKDRQKCIPTEECPKCAANEHFRICGAACESTCTNYHNPKLSCRKNGCNRGCFCNYGYIRDMANNGSCVPIDKCPTKCGSNEHFDESGAPCFRTATNPRPKCLDEQPVPACVCNSGFTRNPNTGICEQLSTLATKCGQNETYSVCNTECGQKCFDRTKRQFCPTICFTGCFCNEGYVRDNRNRICIHPEECSHKRRPMRL